jgi:hypothetical protein
MTMLCAALPAPCRYLYLFDEAKHEGCEDVLIMAADQL